MAYFKDHGSELGANNRRWLGSDHNIRKTHVIDASAFSGDAVLSGTPVQRDGDRVVPYAGGELRGFLYNDYPLEHGDYPVAVVVHGDIKTQFLPVDNFTPPAGTSFTFDVPTAAEGGA